MDIQTILTHATQQGASDIFIVTGLPLTYKINGKLIHVTKDRLMPKDTARLIQGIYTIADGRNYDAFSKNGDDDFSFALPGVSRYRASTYKQRGTASAVIRIIDFNLPDPRALGIPDEVIGLADIRKGMILITGPAGSGKSTTLACMIDHINQTRADHIITLEDPLEHLHPHKMSIVSQREIGTDTKDYVTALRASLRQSPDDILLGEMRDYETINVAMTAAETGHLIISTMHTISAADTIDRVIDAFPPNQQAQIAVQLSMCLSAVVSQQLVLAADGSRLLPVFEVLTVNAGIANMIRDNKTHQIGGLIYSSNQKDLFSMDTYLAGMVRRGEVTVQTALAHATNPSMLQKKLQ